jgi:Papain fold toxin 1, glutamine deamidase
MRHGAFCARQCHQTEAAAIEQALAASPGPAPTQTRAAQLVAALRQRDIAVSAETMLHGAQMLAVAQGLAAGAADIALLGDMAHRHTALFVPWLEPRYGEPSTKPFPLMLPKELQLDPRHEYVARQWDTLVSYLQSRPGQRLAVGAGSHQGFLYSDPAGQVFFAAGNGGAPMRAERFDALPLAAAMRGTGSPMAFVVSAREQDTRRFDGRAFAHAALGQSAARLLSPEGFATFLSTINRNQHGEDGRDNNCERCAISTALWLDGKPAAATRTHEGQPAAPLADPQFLERAFGSSFRPATLAQISKALLAAGPGAHGIVWLTFWDQHVHFFNAAVYRDSVSGQNRLMLIDGSVGLAHAVSEADLSNPDRLLRTVVQEQLRLRANSIARTEIGEQLRSDFSAGRLDAVDRRLRDVSINFMRVDGHAFAPPKSPAELRNEAPSPPASAFGGVREANLAALSAIPLDAVSALVERLSGGEDFAKHARHHIDNGRPLENFLVALMSPTFETYGLSRLAAAIQRGWFEKAELDRPTLQVQPLTPTAASLEISTTQRTRDAGNVELEPSLQQRRVADNETVLRSGATHQALAEPLKIVRAMALDHPYRVFHLNGRRYMAGALYQDTAERSPFNRPDPFDARNRFSHLKVAVVDLDSAQVLSFSGLLPDLVAEHGLYETTLQGRLAPRQLQSFFGMPVR